MSTSKIAVFVNPTLPLKNGAELFTYLEEHFIAAFSATDHLPTHEYIDSYLDSFPITQIEAAITASIPTLFHRQWIRTSYRGHLRALRHAKKKANLPAYQKEIASARLWIGQTKKMFTIVSFFHSITRDELHTFIKQPASLQKGDVILSYKTDRYCKKNLVSWLVKKASNSSITHSMIVAKNDNGQTEILDSGDDTRGVGIINGAIPKRGEVYLILRPEVGVRISAIHRTIDQWYDIAIHHTKATFPRFTNHPFRFSEFKCQLASLLGLVTITMIYLGQPFTPKNPARTCTGYFCSELVDSIFKATNITLSPRGEHDAIVGPIDILYSPSLQLVGAIVHPEENMAELEQEILFQFK